MKATSSLPLNTIEPFVLYSTSALASSPMRARRWCRARAVKGIDSKSIGSCLAGSSPVDTGSFCPSSFPSFVGRGLVVALLHGWRRTSFANLRFWSNLQRRLARARAVPKTRPIKAKRNVPRVAVWSTSVTMTHRDFLVKSVGGRS